MNFILRHTSVSKQPSKSAQKLPDFSHQIFVICAIFRDEVQIYLNLKKSLLRLANQACTAISKMEVQQQPGAPSVIRIKRKRDDAPIDSLYLENNKRRATDHTYVFKRLEVERRVEPIFRQEYDEDGIPKIRATPEGEEKRDPFALGRVRDPQSPTRQQQKVGQNAPAGPRRFHLSRAMSVGDAAKGKSDVATFVERIRVLQVGTDTAQDNSPQIPAVPQERKLKRPSARSRMGHGSGTATPKEPSVEVDASMAEKMDQWSQEASQEEATRAKLANNSALHSTGDAMEIDNEADYVYDTYYRQAVSSAEVPDKGVSFGQLIIDEDQEDLWETYLDGDDSDDKEFETDEEDSNGMVIPTLLQKIMYHPSRKTSHLHRCGYVLILTSSHLQPKTTMVPTTRRTRLPAMTSTIVMSTNIAEMPMTLRNSTFMSATRTRSTMTLRLSGVMMRTMVMRS